MDDDRPLLYAGPRRALLARLGRVTLDELHALDAAATELGRAKEGRGRADRGFWYAWHDGLNLDREHQAEIHELFSDVMVALASALTGIDVARFGVGLAASGGGGALGGIFDMFRAKTPAQRRQETAIGLINDAAAPWNPRVGVVACWNVACAAALRRRLRPETVDILEAPWRAALGEPPA